MMNTTKNAPIKSPPIRNINGKRSVKSGDEYSPSDAIRTEELGTVASVP